MKKLILGIGLFYLFINSHYYEQITTWMNTNQKHISTYIGLNKDVSEDEQKKQYSEDKKVILEKAKALEKLYYDKMLKSYGVDLDTYYAELEKHPNDDAFKKQYIMEQANISEEEYKDKFESPIEKVKELEIKDLYNYIKEISELINE